MGIISWFKNKSYEKSALNITKSLQNLVDAVRADLEGATNNLDHLEFGTNLNQVNELSESEIAKQMEALGLWRGRKTKVVKAQKNFYQDITLWSSYSLEQSFNDIILPVLFSGKLIAISDPCFEPVIIAVFRVCEVVAKQNGVNLEAHTPPEILRILENAGDLYK